MWLTGGGAPRSWLRRHGSATRYRCHGAVSRERGLRRRRADGRGRDLNYDFRTDLIFAGAGGLKIFSQTEREDSRTSPPTVELPADVTSVR